MRVHRLANPASITRSAPRSRSCLRDYLDRYSLEVSSPGFARPLRTREHFASVVGKRASLRTERAVEGRSRFKGEIVEAGASAVTVAVADDQRVAVPYGAIVRGNLIDEG